MEGVGVDKIEGGEAIVRQVELFEVDELFQAGEICDLAVGGVERSELG
jgi:hypothetical protein